MSFLALSGKTFLVFGVANRKSVAWAIAQTLEAEGALVVYSVRSEEQQQTLAGLLANRTVYVCDVEQEGAVDRLASVIGAAHPPLADCRSCF